MPETPLGPTHDATVVLDVGGDVGAVILYAPEPLLGAEIEISPAGRPADRTHTAVRERVLPERSLYAAVYPALPAGDYVLWRSADLEAGTVSVFGGRVTEVDWTSLGGDAAHAHSHDDSHSHGHHHERQEAHR
jgi:hypothetical protein